MSLYILEGPRNSGKTTVAERIATAYPRGVVSSIKFTRTSNPPVFMADFLSRCYLAIIDSRSICVLDRFHLTEFVMRSLDKKVPAATLVPTTHMIDTMLEHCGAITYIIKTSVETRNERGKKRDANHSKNEWNSYKELDIAWDLATKTFKRCKTKIMPGDTEAELEKIVLDIMIEQKSATRLTKKIPYYPPIISAEPEYEVVE